MVKEIGITTKKTEDFSKWYSEVLQKADLVDVRFKLKGFDVLMPNAMMTIREMERLFEDQLESRDHKPMQFPVLIPETYFKKESDHIKGFDAEVFWVTHAGNNKLDEKMILRPTSETAIYPLYALWVRSHLQLPLKLYQIANVYRYETKMTKPLLRTREIRWIETHTVQLSKEDNIKQVNEDMGIFENVVRKAMCIPFILTKKPEWDKFPGADSTYAFECILPDGKTLQFGTTHDLGQKFSKVFDICYLDNKGKKQYAYQTCFGPGISRIFGASVAIHGDDKGAIMPPAIAPIQAVIVPIITPKEKARVYKKCGEVLGALAEQGFRVHLDDREQYTPGFKFHEWEMKGVPVRIEIGPKDIEKGEVSIVRRDFLERFSVPEDKLEEQLLEVMDSIGAQLLKRANEHLKIQDAKDYNDIKKKLKEGGFIRIDFCGNEKCADKLKEDTTAEVRGTLFGKQEKVGSKCAICGKKAKEKTYIAISY